MAEQETTARAMIAKTSHIVPIRRDFEVRGIAQRYTVIRELNIVRWWHDRAEAIGMAFPSRAFEEVSQNYRKPTTEIPEEKQNGDEEWRWKRKVEVALSTRSHRVTSFGSRGTLDLVHHYLPDGTSRIIGRFTWKTPVKSRKYYCSYH